MLSFEPPKDANLIVESTARTMLFCTRVVPVCSLCVRGTVAALARLFDRRVECARRVAVVCGARDGSDDRDVVCRFTARRLEGAYLSTCLFSSHMFNHYSSSLFFLNFIFCM